MNETMAGVRSGSISGLVTVLVAIGAFSACTPTQRLKVGRLTSYGRYGRSISIVGQTAAVGSYQEDGAAPEEGAVYVYSLTGDVWSQQAHLKASDATGGDQFGDAIALSDSGDTLAISASLADQPGAFHAGAVYIFQRTGGEWTQQARLAPPTPEAYQAFGTTVALDDDRLVVGSADRDQGSAVDAGAAYVFERSGSSWGAPVALAAPAPVSQDEFGAAVAVVGSTVFVGALRRDVGGLTDAGAVYVYTLGQSGWTLGQTLVASDRQGDDLFGSALAVSATNLTSRLAIGAVGCDLPGGLMNAGAAYVFTRTAGGTFTQTQKLVAKDAVALDLFGYAVAISKDRVLVGTPNAHVTAVSSGAAYIFDRGASAWSQTAKLAAAKAAFNDTLGGAVAVSGSLALVGATEESVEPGLSSAGSVHAFREVFAGSWAASHQLTASYGMPSDGAGAAMAVSSDTLVTASFSGVDVLRRDLDGWSLTQTLVVPPGATAAAVTTDAGRLAYFGKRPTTTPIGYVDIFARSAAGVWTLEQELVPDLVSVTQVEESANSPVIAMQGTRLVVGAPRFNGGDGRVFIYTRSGSTWTLLQPPLESAIAASNFDMNFGSSIALDGDTLIVSESPSSGIPDPTHPRIGSVHVYAFTNGAFALTQTITAPAPADLDQFGRGVALSGKLLAINGESAMNGRMLHVYRRASPSSPFAQSWTAAVPDLSSTNASMAFEGDLLAVGVPGATFNGLSDAGEVRFFVRQPDDSWQLGGTWHPWDAAQGNGFGAKIGLAGSHLAATNQVSIGAGSVYGSDL